MALPGKQVVLTAQVDGVVAKVMVEEGQIVHAGDLLIQMDDGVQARLVELAELKATAEAEAKKARLEFEEAEITLERLVEAQENRAALAWEVRRARLRRDIAEVLVWATDEARIIAQAELRLEQERLARFQRTAPWDGIVVRVLVEPGATLTHNDPLLKLVSLDELKAEIYLPAGLQDRVKVGRSYSLDTSEPVNRRVEAELTFADPVIDPASQTFRCVFTIQNTDHALPAGFIVELLTSKILSQ